MKELKDGDGELGVEGDDGEVEPVYPRPWESHNPDEYASFEEEYLMSSDPSAL